MRIGTSRADWLGFWVFIGLAAILGGLVITSLGSGSEGASDSTAETTVLSLAASASDMTQVVPTTAPLDAPTATPTPTPWPTPSPTPTAEPTATPTDDAADGATSATNSSGSAATNSTGTTASTPNPQPQTTAVPNPQPQTTAVPNPQPQTTNVDAPPANATGGSFTYSLTAIVPQPSLHTSPGGATFMPTFNGTALPPVNPTVFGNPLVYRVLAGTPDDASGWAQVYVPARPNGTTAWVQTSQFQWGSSNRSIVINVGNNTVTVYEGDSVLLTTNAVTGKSGSPTPIANGWVEEIMAGPSAAYGPRLLSLGLFSNALNSFGGSVPKIALHGTNNPSLMGQYASNGCIRVPNDVITQIAGMVSPGSKVTIVSG